MQSLSDAEQKMVEQQFHNFCLTVLKNEANNIHKSYKRQRKHETFFDDLTMDELLDLSTEIDWVPEHIFSVGEEQVPVANETLVSALQQLPQYKRDIILLYFFLEKTEEEIGSMFKRARQTIHYQKKTILKQLKQYLELEELL